MSHGFAKVPPPTDSVADPIASALASHIADVLWMGSATSPRSLQQRIGFSELGGTCDRALAHRLRGTPRINFPDPLASLLGVGIHLGLAEIFRRRDAGTGRYLIEHPVEYGGSKGTVDLFDRRLKTVIDWKSKPLAKVKRVRAGGPSPDYVTQLHLYGTALREAGEAVDEVALVFLPIDGTLPDIHVWRSPLDPSIAHKAIARLSGMDGKGITDVPATPSPLCPWCAWHRPGSTDLSIACPGKD